MHQLTAAQKLGRLKQIDARLQRRDPSTLQQNADLLDALEVERAAILASVGLPPLELMGNPWGEAWALAFAETFPGFDHDTLLTWFQNACAAGAMRGYEEGQAAGVNERLRETLETILASVRSGGIRCSLSFSRDGGPPRNLGEFIADALEAAGMPWNPPAPAAA